MMGQVRGGLSGKSEEECVRAGVISGDEGDGGATAFHKPDGGGNDGISGGAAGRELGGAKLRWPLGVASGFVEEKWRGRGGGCRLSGEARRGKKNGGSDVSGTTRRKEEGGPSGR
jgi:hypothetical protein